MQRDPKVCKCPLCPCFSLRPSAVRPPHGRALAHQSSRDMDFAVKPRKQHSWLRNIAREHDLHAAGGRGCPPPRSEHGTPIDSSPRVRPDGARKNAAHVPAGPRDVGFHVREACGDFGRAPPCPRGSVCFSIREGFAWVVLRPLPPEHIVRKGRARAPHEVHLSAPTRAPAAGWGARRGPYVPLGVWPPGGRGGAPSGAPSDVLGTPFT